MNRITAGRQFHNLEPARTGAAQRNTSRSLQKILENAETSASSSNNQRLNAARAGIERGGTTAPGSQIPLTANGLLAGGPEEAAKWLKSQSDYKRLLIRTYKNKVEYKFDELPKKTQKKAAKLARRYHKIYRSHGEESSSSRPASSKGKHPTTADSRRLPASAIERQKFIKQYNREWNRLYNPDAVSESDDSSE